MLFTLDYFSCNVKLLYRLVWLIPVVENNNMSGSFIYTEVDAIHMRYKYRHNHAWRQSMANNLVHPWPNSA